MKRPVFKEMITVNVHEDGVTKPVNVLVYEQDGKTVWSQATESILSGDVKIFIEAEKEQPQ